VTTTFVGNHYEVTGSTVTKYYFAGAQRVAVRTGSTLKNLLGDHRFVSSFGNDPDQFPSVGFLQMDFMFLVCHSSILSAPYNLIKSVYELRKRVRPITQYCTMGRAC
jgi:hypothetical protein